MTPLTLLLYMKLTKSVTHGGNSPLNLCSKRYPICIYIIHTDPYTRTYIYTILTRIPLYTDTNYNLNESLSGKEI